MPPGSAERPRRRALLSVSDKTGLVEFARGLAELGFELRRLGRHRRGCCARQGLAVVDVAQLTGSPEMLGGRVKTLHPRVHGGLLARRDHPGDQRDVAAHGIAPIDLVVVNLYPFEATVARAGRELRRGDRADRHRRPVDDPLGRQEPGVGRRGGRSRRLRRGALGAARPGRWLSDATRCALARKAFARTAAYDAAIYAHLAAQAGARARSPSRRVCASISSAASCCATARIRTSARRSTAASSRSRSRCTARSSPTTT